MKFTPDTNHCPESCLCGICQNEVDCDEPCEEYQHMATGCNDDCAVCKAKKVIL